MATVNCLVTKILQNIFFRVQQKKGKHRFGTSGGWVNYDRIFIFGWTVPLRFASLTSRVKMIKRGSANHFLFLLKTVYLYDSRICERKYADFRCLNLMPTLVDVDFSVNGNEDTSSSECAFLLFTVMKVSFVSSCGIHLKFNLTGPGRRHTGVVAVLFGGSEW